MNTDRNPLEKVLKDIIGGIGAKGALTEEAVARAWEEAVGKKAAAHSAPRSLRGARLVINVDDSSWLYELTVQKKEILRKLASKLKSKRARMRS